MSDILTAIAQQLLASNPQQQQAIAQYNPYMQLAQVPQAYAQALQGAPVEDRGDLNKNMLYSSLAQLGAGLLGGMGQNYQSTLTDRYNNVLQQGWIGQDVPQEQSNLPSGLFGHANQGVNVFKTLGALQAGNDERGLDLKRREREAATIDSHRQNLFNTLARGAFSPEFPAYSREQSKDALQQYFPDVMDRGVPEANDPSTILYRRFEREMQGQQQPQRQPSQEERASESLDLEEALGSIKGKESEWRPQTGTLWGNVADDSIFANSPPAFYTRKDPETGEEFENEVLDPYELENFPEDIIVELPRSLQDALGFRSQDAILRKAYDHELEMRRRGQDWWGEIPAMDRRQIVGTMATISTMDGLIRMLDAIDQAHKGDRVSSTIDYQLGGRWATWTHAHRVRQIMKYYAPGIARAQGHTGNLNMRETAVARETLEGKLLASPKDQSDYLRFVRQQLRGRTESQVKTWRNFIRRGGDAHIDALENSRHQDTMNLPTNDPAAETYKQLMMIEAELERRRNQGR